MALSPQRLLNYHICQAEGLLPPRLKETVRVLADAQAKLAHYSKLVNGLSIHLAYQSPDSKHVVETDDGTYIVTTTGSTASIRKVGKS